MVTPEDVRAMSDEAFYLRLKELAGRMKSNVATGEEEKEDQLLWADIVDRKLAKARGDEEGLKERKEQVEEWRRFLNILDDFMDQPQPNKFNEGDKVHLLVDVPEGPAGSEGFVTRVDEPSKKRYDEEGRLVFGYQAVVDLFDPTTLQSHRAAVPHPFPSIRKASSGRPRTS